MKTLAWTSALALLTMTLVTAAYLWPQDEAAPSPAHDGADDDLTFTSSGGPRPLEPGCFVAGRPCGRLAPEPAGGAGGSAEGGADVTAPEAVVVVAEREAGRPTPASRPAGASAGAKADARAETGGRENASADAAPGEPREDDDEDAASPALPSPTKPDMPATPSAPSDPAAPPAPGAPSASGPDVHAPGASGPSLPTKPVDGSAGNASVDAPDASDATLDAPETSAAPQRVERKEDAREVALGSGGTNGTHVEGQEVGVEDVDLPAPCGHEVCDEGVTTPEESGGVGDVEPQRVGFEDQQVDACAGALVCIEDLTVYGREAETPRVPGAVWTVPSQHVDGPCRRVACPGPTHVEGERAGRTPDVDVAGLPAWNVTLRVNETYLLLDPRLGENETLGAIERELAVDGLLHGKLVICPGGCEHAAVPRAVASTGVALRASAHDLGL